jgi:hypothetical protein
MTLDTKGIEAPTIHGVAREGQYAAVGCCRDQGAVSLNRVVQRAQGKTDWKIALRGTSRAQVPRGHGDTKTPRGHRLLPLRDAARHAREDGRLMLQADRIRCDKTAVFFRGMMIMLEL